jgi:lipase maturation factor 1
MLRLIEGQPEVTGLLAKNPFPTTPPKFIRAETYNYHFTDWSTRRSTGAIWTRSYAGEYFPAVSLR